MKKKLIRRVAIILVGISSYSGLSISQVTTEPIINSSILSSIDYTYAGNIRIPYSAGDVHIYNNSTVNLVAGASIMLNPGFIASTAEGCASFSAVINTVLGSTIALSTDRNFIYTRIPNQPVLSETDLDNLSIAHKQLSVQYFDGIGRLLQDVKIQFSKDVSGKDLIRPYEYNNVGLVNKDYLSYQGATSNGLFISTAGIDQQDYYINPTFGVAATHAAFAERLFDNSPIARVVEQGFAGEDYQINSDHHTVRTDYSGNSSNEVMKWEHSGSGASSQGINSPNYFLASTLYKEDVYDENFDVVNSYDGNNVTVYKDVLGRMICKRYYVRTNFNETLDFTNGGSTATGGTYNNYFIYYVYNSLNQLVYVIPPAAVQYMIDNNNLSFAESDVVFQKYIFAYHYDEKSRVIEKKIPGQIGWQWMCYNELDQVVATSTPEQHKTGKNEWTFTKYDILGRVIMSGKYDGALPASITNLQNDVDANSVLWETRDNINSLGYTSNAFPQVFTEAYSINYYDNYDFPFDAILNNRLYMTYGSNIVSNQTKGLVTATKTGSVLGFLRSVNYYDQEGRLIQAHNENHLNGWDIINNEYDFVGKIIKSKKEHQGINTLEIVSRFVYDHENRLTDIHKQIGPDPEVHLVQNSYNSLGQLILKKLNVDATLPNGCLQQIDYRYNTRGWLTSINNSALVDDNGITNSDNADAFGEELYYGNAGSLNIDYSQQNSIVPLPQFNGNISAISWKTKSPEVDPYDIPEHAYVYRYDELNRMTAGYFCSGQPGFNNWFDADFKGYDEKLHYDINGNITKMFRTHKSQLIDGMAYSYEGNLLKDINDAVVATGPGFNGPISNNDYGYDENGNLTSDLNKSITSIEYNYLNLPEKVNTSGQFLDFVYDRQGKKLSKNLNGSNPHEYLDGIEYENGVFQFILTEEGRARPKNADALNNTAFVYDYFIKDHLGNVRTVLTTEMKQNQYAATMEVVNATVENQLFYNLNTTRELLPPGYPVDNTYLPNASTGNVNQGEGKPIGAATVLYINEGEEATIDVKYFIPQLPAASNSFPVITLLNQLANVFFLNPSNGISIAGADQTVRQTWANEFFMNNNQANAFLVDGIFNNENNSPVFPHAYLTYLYYDEEFNFIPSVSGVRQVATLNALGNLSVNGLVAPKSGFLYVYVSNESSCEVYFDNLNIVVHSSALAEKNEYYPYGMLNPGLSLSANLSPVQNYKYNGKELQTELNYNVEDYGARHYDPVIARWMIPDELGEIDYISSPFMYVGGNPIRRIDPDGRTWLDKVAGFTAAVIDNSSFGLVNLRDNYSPTDVKDFNYGQDGGDILSVVGGTAEAIVGEGFMSSGITVTVGTGGLAAEVGMPAALAGSVMVLHGVKTAGHGVLNFAQQKGRVKENRRVDTEHTKNARISTKQKHETNAARNTREQAKADAKHAKTKSTKTKESKSKNQQKRENPKYKRLGPKPK